MTASQRKNRSRTLVLLFAGLLSTSLAHAASMSIGPGDNLGNAVGQLRCGDTLILRAGTYNQGIRNPPGGCDESRRVTIRGAPGEKVILKPSGGDQVILHTTPDSSYVDYDNLEMDASNVGHNCVKFTYSGSDRSNAAHHNRIRNSDLHSSRFTCIFPGRGDVYSNNHIHDGGESYLDHGLYIQYPDVTIENNHIHHMQGAGVHFYQEGTPIKPSNGVIVGNRIHDNGIATNPQAWQVYLWASDNHKFINNLVYNSTSMGVSIAGSNSQVVNNTIVGNRQECIHVRDGADNTVVRNNICWQNGSGVSNQGSGTVQSNNLINVDPLFVNQRDGDFHLKQGSPAINAGTTTGAPATDLAGVARTGQAPDIGAYEFGASAGPPTSTLPAPRNLRIVGQ